MPDKTKRILHRWVWVLAALAVLSLLIYAFAPIQLRFWARGLSGEVLYEYNYTETGVIHVLYDEEKQTITLADTNCDGFMGAQRVRVYGVYDLAAGELADIYGFNRYGSGTSIERDEGSCIIEFTLTVVAGQRGIDYVKYGVYSDYQFPDMYESLLYKERFGDVFVYVTYFYDIGLGVM